MGLGRRDLTKLIYVAAASALTVGSVHAADAQFGADVGLRLAGSDNIALAPPGSEQSDQIGVVSAGFTYSRSRPRLEADVAYQAQAVFYHKASDEDATYHTLDASSRIAAVPDRLYLDLFGIYEQTLDQPAGKYSFNKLTITGNRTDLAAIGASPVLELAIGPNIDGSLRYSVSRVNYKDPTLQGSTERLLDFTLGNTKVRRGGSWIVNYDQQHYQYEVSGDVHYEIFNVQLGFWASPTVRLFTTQGLETDYTRVLNPDPNAPNPGLDDYYWNVGTEWQPSERSKLVVTTGERAFGNSYSLNWNYDGLRGGMSVYYSEGPSSYIRDLLNSARHAGEISPAEQVQGPNANPFFLQKSAGITFVLNRPRTTTGLHLTDDRHYDIEQATLTGSSGKQTERYRGASLDWNWRLNSRAGVGFLLESAERSSTLNLADDQIRYVRLDWSRAVGRQNRFEVALSHEHGEPRSPLGASENRYDETQLSVSITRWFASDPSQAGVPKRFTGYLNAPSVTGL